MLGDQGRAFGGHLQPRGASPPCGDSAFEATAQQRDRTFPGQDRSRPAASLAIGGGPGSYKPRALRGLCIGFVIVELLILLCTYCCCVDCIYIPLYLPQAVSLPPSIETASDLFWHAAVC